MSEWVVLFHVAVAFWFVGGLIGRTVTRGRVFERALAEATERGEVTPELGVAFRDPAVAAARIYEVIVVALIILLMVEKPF